MLLRGLVLLMSHLWISGNVEVLSSQTLTNKQKNPKVNQIHKVWRRSIWEQKRRERPMRTEAEAQNTGKAGRPEEGHEMKAGTRHKMQAWKRRRWIMSEYSQED